MLVSVEAGNKWPLHWTITSTTKNHVQCVSVLTNPSQSEMEMGGKGQKARCSFSGKGTSVQQHGAVETTLKYSSYSLSPRSRALPVLTLSLLVNKIQAYSWRKNPQSTSHKLAIANDNAE